MLCATVVVLLILSPLFFTLLHVQFMTAFMVFARSVGWFAFAIPLLRWLSAYYRFQAAHSDHSGITR